MFSEGAASLQSDHNSVGLLIDHERHTVGIDTKRHIIDDSVGWE
jgi:hypothetical protein